MAKLKFNPENVYSDARAMPAYSIPLAAQYLRLPPATLRSWFLGRPYRTSRDVRRFKPVFSLPDASRPLLSFFNLAESHVLRAFRAEHRIQLPRIRAAIDYLCEQFGSPHPLIQHQFLTDGRRLFVSKLCDLLEVSSRGQRVFPGLEEHLERLEFANDLAVRLYPFTRRSGGPKTVFIDPAISFGRPTLTRAHIPTDILAERYSAGESIAELADDYGCETLEIEEAIRYELNADSAAAA